MTTSTAAATPAPAPVSKTIDTLDEDYITIPSQNFALVSFIAPTGNQKCDRLGLKIRGCFATREDAAAHVKRLMQVDPLFDIFLVETGKWLAIPPPDPATMDDAEYTDQPFLQSLMQQYRESQTAAKAHFEERKRGIMQDGLDAHLAEGERLPPPTQGLPAPIGTSKHAGLVSEILVGDGDVETGTKEEEAAVPLESS